MITGRSLGLSATHTTSLFRVGRPRSGAGPRLNCAELTGTSLSLSQSIAVYILLLINFKYVAGRLCPHGYAEAGWPQLRAHPPRERAHPGSGRGALRLQPAIPQRLGAGAS